MDGHTCHGCNLRFQCEPDKPCECHKYPGLLFALGRSRVAHYYSGRKTQFTGGTMRE